MTSEFGLLGPLLVRRDGITISIPAAKQRAVLAALLLHPNEVVSTDQLIDILWAEKPPRSAKVTLQNYVKRVRMAIGDVGHSRITTAVDGYRITAIGDELDISFLEALHAKADRVANLGVWDEAAGILATAQALWRGEPLADIPGSQLFVIEAQRLTALRLQVIEDRIAADLHLGRHRKVIAELELLTRDNASRERLYELLMLALFRDGRQADALQAYRHARETLIEEFGVEPCATLQDLHRHILAGDNRLLHVATAEDARVSGVVDRPVRLVPRQLPPAVRGFVGREAELKILDVLVDEEATSPGALGIAMISGSAGVGKTALAVQWCHRVADRFPDGHLFIDLRGFAAVGEPISPVDAIRGLLDAVHACDGQIPADPAAQAALYRTLVATKQMLIILDNAGHEDQVRPLLPGSCRCVAVVTSRRQLTGLAAMGALPVPLEMLTEAEGLKLLATRLGPERVQSEPVPAREVVRLCAGLPLAVAIAAARVGLRPHFPLAVFADQLRNSRTRLDVLTATRDATMDVRSVLSWSYRQLGDSAARILRLIGLHPGPEVSAAAAASLAGISVTHARCVLAELAAANLLAEISAGRFACHDLLHAYAAERADQEEGDTERWLSMRRVLDFYLHTSSAAALLLNPARDPVALPPRQPDALAEDLTDASQALAWFGVERQTLIRAVSWAADNGFDAHSWQLAWSLVDFLERHGYWNELASIQRAALAAATRSADVTGQAHAHHYAGLASLRLAIHNDAESHLRSALDLFARIGYRAAQARVQLSLGRLFASQGRYDVALTHVELSRELFGSIGHRQGQANALNNAGWYWAHAGSLEHALTACHEALGLFRELGDANGEARTWDSLGLIHHRAGRYEAAIEAFEAAVPLYPSGGDRYNHGGTLSRLGDTYRAAGQPAAARAAWEQAIVILDGLRHPDAGRLRAALRELDQQSSPARRRR